MVVGEPFVTVSAAQRINELVYIHAEDFPCSRSPDSLHNLTRR